MHAYMLVWLTMSVYMSVCMYVAHRFITLLLNSAILPLPTRLLSVWMCVYVVYVDGSRKCMDESIYLSMHVCTVCMQYDRDFHIWDERI